MSVMLGWVQRIVKLDKKKKKRKITIMDIISQKTSMLIFLNSALESQSKAELTTYMTLTLAVHCQPSL